MADLEHDDKLDLVVGLSYEAPSAPLLPGQEREVEREERVAVYLGNGDGTFRAGPVYSQSPGRGSVMVADFNGDGHPDMAQSTADARAALRSGNGDGTFGALGLVGVRLSYVRHGRGAVGDFNGDGRPDLAFAASEDGYEIAGGPTGSGVDVLLNLTGVSARPCVVVPLRSERVRVRSALSAQPAAEWATSAAATTAASGGTASSRSGHRPERSGTAPSASISSSVAGDAAIALAGCDPFVLLSSARTRRAE